MFASHVRTVHAHTRFFFFFCSMTKTQQQFKITQNKHTIKLLKCLVGILVDEIGSNRIGPQNIRVILMAFCAVPSAGLFL